MLTRVYKWTMLNDIFVFGIHGLFNNFWTCKTHGHGGLPMRTSFRQFGRSKHGGNCMSLFKVLNWIYSSLWAKGLSHNSVIRSTRKKKSVITKGDWTKLTSNNASKRERKGKNPRVRKKNPLAR